MICENCGKEFFEDWRKDRKTRKKPCKFCCRSCSNTRNISLNTKEKIKQSLCRFVKDSGKIRSIYICERCGKEFKRRKNIRLCRACRPKREISEETRNILSKKRKEFLESGNSHVLWHSFNVDGNTVKVQGSWEKAFAEKLLQLGVKFERKELRFSGYRRYTPDFFLPDFSMFVEIKGFFYEKDKLKMFICLEDNDIDLRILESLDDINNLNNLDELLLLPIFKKKYKKEDIKLEKFFNRY